MRMTNAAIAQISPIRPGQATIENLEDDLWQALDMDSLHDEMITGAFHDRNAVFMGTGATQNACYMCSNSATTAGCGTCG